MTDTNEPTELTPVEATGNEIDAIVVKLEKALEGDRVDHSIIGLIALAVFFMNPKISVTQLERAIEDVTTFAAVTVAEGHIQQKAEDAQAPKVSLN